MNWKTDSIKFFENSPELWHHKLPKIKQSDDKYSRGHLLINGSGVDSTGATKLASFAAARTGAGMITVACDQESLPIYAASFQSIMAKAFDKTGDIIDYINRRKVQAVLLGPGNGKSVALAERVVKILKNKDLKAVLDADAISVFEHDHTTLFKVLHSEVVLTPHANEFLKLFEFSGSKLESAVNAAKTSGAVVVLKGNDTIIASPDDRVIINSDAPVELASAGTGDVLAGIIASFMAQGMAAYDAAAAGVYIHSKAAKLFGSGLIADDLPLLIPQVLKKL